MKNGNSFSNFLKYTLSQKEISLAIAKDEKELKEFENLLGTFHYKKATQVSQMLLNVDGPSKLYFTINSRLPKELYDFIVQYPTGQIEIYDINKMQSTVMNPYYKNFSLVLLVTKEELANIQQGSFTILDKIGLTYQT